MKLPVGTRVKLTRDDGEIGSIRSKCALARRQVASGEIDRRLVCGRCVPHSREQPPRHQARGGAMERHQEFSPEGVRLLPVSADAEAQLLASPGGKVEGAEQPIPDREAAAQVLVEVDRIAGVMDLMMRGAHDQPAQRAAQRDPHVRMLQVGVAVDEQHQQDVGLRQRVLSGRLSEHVMAQAVADRRREREDVGEDQHVAGMDAEGRHRREHGRGMVNLVEFPHEGHAVAEVVVDPVAELVGQEQQQRDHRARDERGQR